MAILKQIHSLQGGLVVSMFDYLARNFGLNPDSDKYTFFSLSLFHKNDHFLLIRPLLEDEETLQNDLNSFVKIISPSLALKKLPSRRFLGP